MKTHLKCLAMICAIALPNTIIANEADGFSTFIGIDLKWQYTPGKSDWKNLLAKSYPAGAIYLGTRFLDNWGLEFGLNETTKKSKTHTFHNGENFFNNGNMNGVQTKIDTQLRGAYLDLNGYYPLSHCWDIVGSMGVGVIKPKVTLSVLNNALPSSNSTLSTTSMLSRNDAYALTTTHGKAKSVFRIGLGSQYMLSETIGLRANLRWESTTSLRVDGNYQFQQSSLNTTGLRKIFINTASLSAGAFFKFY